MKKIVISIISLFSLLFLGYNVQAREISEVPHWQKSTITVFIPKKDDKGKTASLKRAFARWQGASSNRIRFRYVEKGPADIDVIWTDSANGSSPISSTSVSSSGTSINKAEIHLATKDPKFSQYSNNYVYTVMLHEIGKAIGMPVNGRKKSSIMHAPVDVKQDIMKIDVMKLYSINGWSYATRNTPSGAKQAAPQTAETTPKATTPEKKPETKNSMPEKPDLDNVTPKTTEASDDEQNTETKTNEDSEKEETKE
jgi:hypothetical protein